MCLQKNCICSDALDVQEDLETPGADAAYVRRISKPGNVTKTPSKTPKPAGLSKPGKKDTPKPASLSKATKVDATKEVAVPKLAKVVQKVA